VSTTIQEKPFFSTAAKAQGYEGVVR
jgi:hypothetical protein